jgi:hypothetical protein
MTDFALIRRRFAAFGFLSMLVLAGCEKPQISVYTAPKDKASPAAAAQALHAAAAARPRPELTWTLPGGWKESAPGRLSLAAFSVAGTSGGEANASITPLPSLAGREADVVNMWREQMGLPSVEPADALALLKPADVAGETGKIFELSNRPAGSTGMVAVVTAFAHRGDRSWFYRFTGDADVVTAQRAAFVEFVKSVRIKEVAPAADTAAPSDSAASKWKIPAGWKTLAAGQMQAAKFAVPDVGAAKAEVTISIFPSDTGGLLANIRRWRGQIGLADASEQELLRLATPLDPTLANSTLVDINNKGKRLVGAVVPRSGQWYFYKLLGDSDAVAPQKNAFVEFAKSQP